MANVVEIKIVVDNAQAIPAVKQTITAFDQMPDAINRNTSALEALTSRLGATGVSLVNTGNAMRTMGGHASTSLDAVRLLSQEFGLRLPRALESMIARSQAASTALQAFVGVAAGIAVAEVIYRAGDALYNAYEKYISLTAAADAYNKTVEAHRDEDFINTRSLEDTVQRLQQATVAAKQFKQVGEDMNQGGWHDILQGFASANLGQAASGVAGLLAGRGNADAGYKSQGQADALSAKRISDEHELAMLQIEQNHAADGALQGQVKLNAELAKKLELNRENRRFTQEQSSALQGYGLRSSGSAKEQAEDAIARQTNAAQTIELQRQVTEKTISLQNEARNAGLQGNALYLAQRDEAEAAIRRSATGTAAQIDAIQAKYHADQIRRIHDEADALAKAAEDEKIAGLTGLAKIQEQGNARLNDIDTKQRKGGFADPASAGKERTLAQQATLREMRDAETAFQQGQRAESDRADMEKLSGFARIDAQLEASLAKRADDYQKFYGQLGEQDARYQAAHDELDRGDRADNDAANRQRAELTQQINDRTLEMDKQAAEAEKRVRGDGLQDWIGNYRQTTAEIVAAHDAMNAKIDAEQRKTGGDPGQYEQQKVDADRIANAQIAGANQQLQHQIAGTLEEAFTDPVRAIQNKMKTMFFNILADWIMQSNQFKGVFGNMFTMGQSSHGAGGGGLVGGISAIGAAAGPASSAGLSLGAGAASSPSGSPVGSLIGGTSGSTSASSSGLNLPSALSGTVGLAQTGMAAVGALGTSSSSSASDPAAYDPWSDPTRVSSSDPSSPAYHGAAVTGSGASGLSVAGLAGAGVATYTGVTGIMSSFESGKASGIFTGAESGAAMGAGIGMLAGPLGAGIGAGIGAAGGAAAGLVGWATGEGGNLAGAKYFKDNIRPAMMAQEQSYMHGGGGTASSAISSINSTAEQGLNTIGVNQGASVEAWVRASYVDKLRNQITSDISRLAGGGRDYMAASAAQFHDGGLIRGFGGLGTGGDEGFIHAQMGEVVTSRADSLEHAPMLQAIGSGATPAEIASMYLQTSGSSSRQTSGSSGGDTHHWNVNAIDARSFRDMLVNGGGMDQIAYAANKRATRYAGDAP